jgi:hypothetical protein
MMKVVKKTYAEVEAGDFVRIGGGYEPPDFALVQEVIGIPPRVEIKAYCKDGEVRTYAAGGQDQVEVADLNAAQPWIPPAQN